MESETKFCEPKIENVSKVRCGRGGYGYPEGGKRKYCLRQTTEQQHQAQAAPVNRNRAQREHGDADRSAAPPQTPEHGFYLLRYLNEPASATGTHRQTLGMRIIHA